MSRSVSAGLRSTSTSGSAVTSFVEVAAGDSTDLQSKLTSSGGIYEIRVPPGIYTLSNPLLFPNTMQHADIIIKGCGASWKTSAETKYGTVIKGSAGLSGKYMCSASDIGIASAAKMHIENIRFETTGNETGVWDYSHMKPWLINCYHWGSLEGYGTGGRTQRVLYGSTSGDRSDLGWIDGVGSMSGSRVESVFHIKGENVAAGTIFANVNGAGDDCVLYLEPSIYGTSVENFRCYLQGSSNPVNLITYAGYYGTRIGTVCVTHDATSTYVTSGMLNASTRSGSLQIEHFVDSTQPDGTAAHSQLFANTTSATRSCIGMFVKRLRYWGVDTTYVPGATYAEYDGANTEFNLDVTQFSRARVFGKWGSNSGDATTKGVSCYNKTDSADTIKLEWTDNTLNSYRDAPWIDISGLSGQKTYGLYAKSKAGTDFQWGGTHYTQAEFVGFKR